MNYQFTLSFFLQLIPCLIAIVLVYVLWSRRHNKGVLYLLLLEISATIWALTDNLEHAATTSPLKIFWSVVGSFGTSTTGVFFLLFTLSFTQRYKFTNLKSLLWLLVVPLITVILSFTNQYHHLIFADTVLLPETNDIIYKYGTWFWIFIFYEYSLILLSIIILFLSTSIYYKIYKDQSYLLMVLYLLPLITSILFIFQLTPLYIDLTPTALITSGIFVGLGIYWKGVVEIMPVAQKQIIDNLSDGIIVIDTGDRIIDANHTIELISGLNHKELIGQSFGAIKDKLFHHNFDHSDGKSFKTETSIVCEGGKRYYEVAYNPVFGDRQRVVGKIFKFHDITIRKLALQSAVEANHQLRKEISEKERLIVDLDAYARSVAHDLKNPIAGMLGMSEVIKDDFINNKQEAAFELLDLAHEQGLKMHKIIDGLLLLSMIRQEDVKPVPLDMDSIFKEAVKRLKGTYDNKNYSIETPESWPTVLGHAQWIEEVWFNLISNAVKYGGNPPLIKTGYDKVTSPAFRFWIIDNGDGLPADAFEKIFNEFERLDKRNIEGHGFGLSIVKRIIEKLGGEVSVSSENAPGKGCTFSFTLKSFINEEN